MDNILQLHRHYFNFILTPDGARCGRPEQPVGSLVKVEEDAGTASLVCKEGFNSLTESDTHLLMCHKGTWQGTLPVCRGEEMFNSKV